MDERIWIEAELEAIMVMAQETNWFHEAISERHILFLI